MFKNGFYGNIFANEPATIGTIKLGCTRGKGSSTRMFNWCHQHSPNPSECINEFITTVPNSPFTLINNNFTGKLITVIYDNENNLYVTIDGNNNNSGIYKVTNNSVTLFANSSIISTPVAMTFSQDYSKLYVVGFTENSIFEIDVASQTIINTITNANLSGAVLDFPNGCCFDSTFTNLYVTNIGNGNIIKIDVSSGPLNYNGSLISNLGVLSSPILIAYNPKNNNLYVTSLLYNCVYQITLLGTTTTYISGSSNILNGPRGISFDNKFNYLYITNYNSNGTTPSNINYISKFNVENPSNPIFVTNIIGDVLNETRGLCFNPNNINNYLVVSNFGSNSIYQYNVSQNI